MTKRLSPYALRMAIFTECDNAMDNGYDETLVGDPETIAEDIVASTGEYEDELLKDLADAVRAWQAAYKP